MVEVERLLLNGLVNSTPLMLAALGEMVVERSGRVNLGVEGFMAVGAAASVYASMSTGSAFMGLLAASLTASLLALIYVVVVLLLDADQIVVGLILVFMGVGLSELIGGLTGGLPGSTIPALGPVDPVVIVALALAVLLWIVISRTWIGVEIRALGESDEIAAVRGLRALRIRGIAVVVGGLLAGLAGAYMSMEMHYGRWYSGITAGWGWIAIGIVILGYWHPIGVAIASYLVGLLLASRTLLASLGVNTAVADSIPYITVVAALAVAVKLSERLGLSPPSLIWRKD